MAHFVCIKIYEYNCCVTYFKIRVNHFLIKLLQKFILNTLWTFSIIFTNRIINLVHHTILKHTGLLAVSKIRLILEKKKSVIIKPEYLIRMTTMTCFGKLLQKQKYFMIFKLHIKLIFKITHKLTNGLIIRFFF